MVIPPELVLEPAPQTMNRGAALLEMWVPPRGNPARPLIGIGFAMPAAIYCVGPFIPLYVAAHGGGVAAIAAFVALSTVAAAISQYPAGWLVDRVGSRRVFVIGQVVYVATALILLFGVLPWQLLLLARCIQGFAMGAFFVTLRASLTQVTTADERGVRFAQLESAFNIAALVGPVVGGGIAAISPNLLFAAASVTGAGVLFAAAGIPAKPAVGRHTPEKTAVRLPLTSALVVPVLVIGCFSIMSGLLLVAWPQYLLARGGNTGLIGLTVSLWGLPSIVMVRQAGAATLSTRRKAYAAWGIGLAAGCALAYAVLHSMLLIVAVVVLNGVALAFVAPIAYAVLGEVQPPEASARAMAMAGVAEFGGLALGASTLGPLYTSAGPVAAFGAAALLVLASAVVVVLFLPGRPSPSAAVTNQGD